MDCQAHEHLELVILAQPAAGRLYLGDQLSVHPPQLRGPGHRAGSGAWCHLLRRAGRTVVGTASPHQLRLVEVIDNLEEEVPNIEIATKESG